MKRTIVLLVVFAGTLIAPLNYSSAEEKDEELKKLIAEINLKMDAIMRNQEKLSAILKNQEQIMAMLRVRRLH